MAIRPSAGQGDGSAEGGRGETSPGATGRRGAANISPRLRRFWRRWLVPLFGTQLSSTATNAVGKISAGGFMMYSSHSDYPSIPCHHGCALQPGPDGQQPLQTFDVFERIRQWVETRLNSSSAMTCRDRACSAFCCAAESRRG